MSEKTQARRPLKVRDVGVVQSFARYLSDKNITPNQISVGSVAFAALAGISFILAPRVEPAAGWSLWLLAALFIQLRLLCNLFDGMVAVEGGKSTPSGELFNDIPDRIADPLILVAAGYGITVVPWGAELGWCAGLLAVMTAYVRTLSASIGAPVDFSGPMAKQHRMALLTAAAVGSALESVFGGGQSVLLAALVLIVIGSALTSMRRAVSAYRHLEA
jgi:phosphatidylglycerophosphate synthase